MLGERRMFARFAPPQRRRWTRCAMFLAHVDFSIAHQGVARYREQAEAVFGLYLTGLEAQS